MNSKTKSIIAVLTNVIALVSVGLMTNFVTAGSESESDKDLQCEPPISECIRENKAMAFLEILPSDDLKYLSQWCVAHNGVPVSENIIIDVPNYVTCGEVSLSQLNRGLEQGMQRLEDYCSGKLTLTPEEEKKLLAVFHC